MDRNTNVDEVWKKLGKWGRFQVFQLGLIYLSYWSIIFQLLCVVFIGYRPDYQCAPALNDGSYHHETGDGANYIIHEKCGIKIYKNSTNSSVPVNESSCIHGYQYSLPKDATFVTEMDLVCDKAGLAELSQTLVMVGQTLGACVGSSMSDRFGRKTIHVISHLAVFGIGFGVAFAPDYTSLALFRFLSGVFQQGISLAGSVLALEYVTTDKRYIVEVFGLFFWATGVSLVAPIAYLMRNSTWRHLQLVFTAFSSFSLIQFWLEEESLRWLLMNNKTKEAERVVRKACRWNKQTYEDVIKNPSYEKMETIPMLTAIQNGEHNTSIHPANIQEVQNKEVERYTIITIFKNRRILINTLIMWFAWMTSSATYYGLTLTSTSLAGNKYVNFFIMGAVEYVACAFEVVMLPRYGRRNVAIFFNAVTGFALASSTVIKYFSNGNDGMVVASLVFTFIGKMAIGGSFSTIYLYTPELYPTNLRNAGIGFSSAAARIGSMIAPFTGLLASYIVWGPGAVFSCMCLIVTVMVYFLPETTGVELPKTLSQLNIWFKENSRGSIKNKKKADSLWKESTKPCT